MDIDYQIKLPGMKEQPPGGGNSLRDVIHDPNILREKEPIIFINVVRSLSIDKIYDNIII